MGYGWSSLEIELDILVMCDIVMIGLITLTIQAQALGRLFDKKNPVAI